MNASGQPPAARHGHASAVFKGDLYVLGGQADDGTLLADCYVFNIKSKTWSLFEGGEGKPYASSYTVLSWLFVGRQKALSV